MSNGYVFLKVQNIVRVLLPTVLTWEGIGWAVEIHQATELELPLRRWCMLLPLCEVLTTHVVHRFAL
jgi:hypothetical protein